MPFIPLILVVLVAVGVVAFGWKLQAGPLALTVGGALNPNGPPGGPPTTDALPWIPILLIGGGAALLLSRR